MWRRLRKWLLGSLLLLIFVPVLVIGALRWVDPPISAFMLAQWLDDRRQGVAAPIEHEWVELAAISRHLQLAVIAAEDQKFPRHWGFDLEAIRGALATNAEGRVRGASTLTQQVAKNLFLWSGRNYVRKGLEAYLTALIELLWPKRRILEVYLNVAQFGDHLYGAEAAAQKFYGIDAGALGPLQASRLAAVLPSPKRLSPARPSPYVIERAGWIQGQMRNLGLDYLPR